MATPVGLKFRNENNFDPTKYSVNVTMNLLENVIHKDVNVNNDIKYQMGVIDCDYEDSQFEFEVSLQAFDRGNANRKSNLYTTRIKVSEYNQNNTVGIEVTYIAGKIEIIAHILP